MGIPKKIFRYIEPMWLGTDGKLSIRRLFAIVFTVDFIRNIHHTVFQWEIGKSYSDAALLLGIEAGLIAALLSLTTYSSYLTRNRSYGGGGGYYGGGGSHYGSKYNYDNLDNNVDINNIEVDEENI